MFGLNIPNKNYTKLKGLQYLTKQFSFYNYI